MKYDLETFRLTDTAQIEKISLIVGGAGLILSVIGLIVDFHHFMHSYLTAVIFWITLPLGALFFTMLHHLAGATWSIVLRRLSENIMALFPLMALLFIPVLIGMHGLYHWADSAAVASDKVLMAKHSYLNQWFFILRTVIYFLIWFALARSLHKISLEQDANFDENQAHRMRKISAFGMVLFAITVTFAAFDWLMSLDANWYSTIFGVYVFSGSAMGILVFLTLIALYLRNSGILSREITLEHYNDLGKLTFAFMIFWAYMAFSQYFLIWYGNIPEETIWFRHRWEGSWQFVSLLLAIGHFGVPFFILITRGVKRNLVSLGIISGWLLLMHWVDMYWLVLPSFNYHNAIFSWMDITLTLGIGGIFIWALIRKFKSSPIIPVNDPRLENSLRFRNF